VTVTEHEVRQFILDHVDAELRLSGGSISSELPDDHDLLLTGLIDSLGLLDLTTALSEYVGRELDFDRLDPDSLTVLGPLSRYVAAEASR
jgi:acyl carrier protein